MEPELKPILVAREFAQSDSGPREYAVSVYSDGTALCECVAFAIQRNKGNLDYQCKHISRVLAQDGIAVKMSAARIIQKREARRLPPADRPAYEGRKAKTIDL